MKKIALRASGVIVLASILVLAGSYVHAQVIGTSAIPTAKNVLCVYNSTSSISKQICDYYVSKRFSSPQEQTLHELGLPLADSLFDPLSEHVDKTGNIAVPSAPALRENMGDTNFVTNISVPIAAYVKAHPEMNITHLAVAKDMPIKVRTYTSAGVASVLSAAQFLALSLPATATLSTVSRTITNELATPSSGQCLQFKTHFDPTQCSANASGVSYRFAVSYLTGWQVADVLKMIDKATTPTNTDLSQVVWYNDNDAYFGALAVTKFGAPDTRILDSQIMKSKLMAVGVPSSQIVLDTDDTVPIVSKRPLIAFGGNGIHASYAVGSNGDRQNWPVKWAVGPNAFVQMPVADRAILDNAESFFAITANSWREGGVDQGTVFDGLKPTAFGGTNYSNSFSGGFGTVAEPGLDNIMKFEEAFPDYASGMTLGEVFLHSGHNRPQVLPVGDPLMRISDAATPFTALVNKAPVVTITQPSQVLTSANNQPVTAMLKATISDDGLPASSNRLYGSITTAWSQKTGVTQAIINPATTVNGETTISSQVTLPQTGHYEFQLAASDSQLTGTAVATIDVRDSAASVTAANQAPKIVLPTTSADKTGALPLRIGLSAVVTDDGFPRGQLSIHWEKVSGPGNATFDDANVVSPRITIDQNGVYIFKVTATDGDQSVTAYRTVGINAVSPTNPVIPTAPTNPVTPGSNQTTPGVVPDTQPNDTDTGVITRGSLTKTLLYGMNDPEVVVLKALLRNGGYSIVNTTDSRFDDVTLQAVRLVQCNQLKLCSGTPSTNGYGQVGPSTRRIIMGFARNITPSRNPIADPIAALLVDGSHDMTYVVGTKRMYTWNSTNGDTYSSSYTSNNPTQCGVSTSWSARTDSGYRVYAPVDERALAGCVYTITYTVSNSRTGKMASDTVTVHLIAAPQNPTYTNTPYIAPVTIQCTQTVVCGNQQLNGKNFTPTGNTVKIGSTVAGVYNSLNNGTQITFAVPSGLATGSYPVTVTNAYGTSNSATFVLLAQTTLPSVSMVTPNAGPIGTTITITGRNFVTSGTNNIQLTYGNYSINLKGTSNDGIHMTLPLTYAYSVPVGTVLKLYVDNDKYGFSDSDPTYAANPVTFTVTAAAQQVVAPTITSLSASHGLPGSILTISGNSLTNDTSIDFRSASGGYNSVNHIAASGNTVSFSVPSLTPGAYTVSLRTIAGNSSGLSFTIDAPTVIKTTLNSASLQCTQGVPCSNLALNGSNFTSSGNIVMIGSTNAGTYMSLNNGTQLSFNVPSNLAVGTYSVTVTNTYGTSNSVTLTVLAGSTLPTITSVSPASGPVGTSITITGRNFSTSATNNIQLVAPTFSVNLSAVSPDGTHLTVPLNYGATIPANTILKVYVDNDQYGFSDNNPTYAANPVTFIVTASQTQSQSQVQAASNPPTATFTIEGAHSYTYTVGQTNHYAWSSTNADTYSSSYTATGPSACGTSGAWVANSSSGQSSTLMTSTYTGCTWTVTYTARNSQTGQSASDTVTVKVNAASSAPSSGSSQASAAALSLPEWWLNLQRDMQTAAQQYDASKVQ